MAVVCPKCRSQNVEGASVCTVCGSSLREEASAPQLRKTITVVFCDVVGSSRLGERLDTEVLSGVMRRYFDLMRAVIEMHGGTVEKFIGDAVVAVFGYPTTHEDDALRAIRAAAAMRVELAKFNQELWEQLQLVLETRTGVNTGEVLVAGAMAPGSNFAAGDAMNTGARLQQLADPGEILIGESTWRLVREAVRAEPMEPSPVRGKAELVRSWRLLGVEPGGGPIRRHLESPLVGRERPLTLLGHVFSTVSTDRVCHLVTIIGAAGVGKSRLVREFVSTLPAEALVLEGRCLPYGEGITYWPIHEIFVAAAGIGVGDPTETALSRLASVGWEPEIADRIAQLLGLVAATAQADEIAWSVRRALETLARDRPLVVVVDDIHWAEPTMLDLLDHVADLSRTAPILVVCLARPDLLEHRPGWGAGKLNAVSALLQPLTGDESAALIDNLLGRAELPLEARAMVVEAAGGNPLFVEQILLMLMDDGLLQKSNGHWALRGELTELHVPPTIDALLAARLDRLDPDERSVIACAAVVGKSFSRGAIAALAPQSVRSKVEAKLASLVRKEFVTPDASGFDEQEAYRFLHILIRDAAYDAVPKAERATLHEAVADWLIDRSGERGDEYAEIVAYHLERAYGYRSELGAIDTRSRQLAARAGEILNTAGRRALARNDLPAASNLMQRAVALMSPGEPRTDLLVQIGIAGTGGGDFEVARAALAEAGRWAREAGHANLAAHVTIAEVNLALKTDPSSDLDDAERRATSALAVFEADGDDLGMARAWNLLGSTRWFRLQARAREEALERAADHAIRAGARSEELEALYYLSWTVGPGPTPAEAGIRRLDTLLERSGGDPRVEAAVLLQQGVLLAMLGRFDEARRSARRSTAILEELGHRVEAEATRGEGLGYIEAMAGDLEASERLLRHACESLAAMGETSYLSTEAAQLALVLCARSRFDEAEHFVRTSQEFAGDEDLSSQALWRAAESQILANRERFEEAVATAEAAVAALAPTDILMFKADVQVTLADVLERAGRSQESIGALREAVAFYEQKGNLVWGDQTRRRLAEALARHR